MSFVDKFVCLGLFQFIYAASQQSNSRNTNKREAPYFCSLVSLLKGEKKRTVIDVPWISRLYPAVAENKNTRLHQRTYAKSQKKEPTKQKLNLRRCRRCIILSTRGTILLSQHLKTRHFRITNSRISSNFWNTRVHRTRSSGLSYKYGDNPTSAFAIPRYSFRRIQLSAAIASVLRAKGAKKKKKTRRRGIGRISAA